LGNFAKVSSWIRKRVAVFTGIRKVFWKTSVGRVRGDIIR
jgi:hypothetical protein